MTQFAAFHVGGADTYNDVPVAAGTDREAVFALALKRVEAAQITDGGIMLKQRDDIEPNKFKEMCENLTDEWAAVHLAAKYDTNKFQPPPRAKRRKWLWE